MGRGPEVDSVMGREVGGDRDRGLSEAEWKREGAAAWPRGDWKTRREGRQFSSNSWIPPSARRGRLSNNFAPKNWDKPRVKSVRVESLGWASKSGPT
jgi:hypothetical protein